MAQDYKTAYVDNLRRIGLLPAESEARDQEKEVNRIFPVEHKAERQTSVVLASDKSKLAACFYLPERGQLFTLDFDCLIRLWDLVEGQCLRSYPLEVLDYPAVSRETGNIQNKGV